MDWILNRLKKIKFLAPYLNPDTLKQVFKYLIVGFTSFGVEISFYALLVKVFKVDYLLANIIVFSIIFWFNFLLNRIWSFKSKKAFLKQLIQYGFLFAFNFLVANYYLFMLLNEVVGLDPVLSKFFIMVPIVSWNFILYKTVIYK